MLRQLFRDGRELARVVGEGTITPISLTRAVLIYDSFPILATTRLREAARRLRLPGVNRMLRLLQIGMYGIEIGKDVRLGAGVYFVHTLGTVIGGDAEVGERVRFFGSNTVGASADGGCPRIGDDVTIGAGARLVGPIRIGAGATIGANAVVLCDVPPGCVAVGVPARILPPRGARA